MRWSVSADRALRRCERQVLYSQVLASHSAIDPLRRETFVLKSLVRQEMWQGLVVHRLLETQVVPSLRAKKTAIAVEDLTEAAVSLGRRQFAFSEGHKYRTASRAEAGDDFAALYGHEYGPAPSKDEVVETLRAVARTCFTNLARRRELLSHLAGALRLEPERAAIVNIAGVTIMAKPDLVAISPSRYVTIIDWKVGASLTATNTTQLLVYALAVLRSEVFGAFEPESIRLVEANLIADEIHSTPVTRDALDETEDFIYRSGARLRSALTLSPGEELLDRLHDLQPASSPGTCALCNFRSVCAASLAEVAPPPPAVQGTLF